MAKSSDQYMSQFGQLISRLTEHAARRPVNEIQRAHVTDNLITEMIRIRNMSVHGTSLSQAQMKSIRQDKLMRLMLSFVMDRRGLWRFTEPDKLRKHGAPETRIIMPPGYFMGVISELVFSKRTREKVIVPILADMQYEYCEAIADGRSGKAVIVRIRGYLSFVVAALAVMLTVLKTVAEIWRKIAP